MACQAYLCKSDLTAAFEAARAAGLGQIRFVLETPDGHRFEITAGAGACGCDTKSAEDMTPLEKWRAERVAR